MSESPGRKSVESKKSRKSPTKKPMKQKEMVFGGLAPPNLMKQQSLKFKKKAIDEFNIQENKDEMAMANQTMPPEKSNVCIFHPKSRRENSMPGAANRGRSTSRSNGSKSKSKASKSSAKKSHASEETGFHALSLSDKERHLYILK